MSLPTCSVYADQRAVRRRHGNQRVVVFDAETGDSSEWGALKIYDPTMTANWRCLAPGNLTPMQFGLVHAARVSRDNIVYVADRTYRGCRSRWRASFCVR
jgi:hypothetical protein